jgi:AcrR family transcriptional regulator
MDRAHVIRHRRGADDHFLVAPHPRMLEARTMKGSKPPRTSPQREQGKKTVAAILDATGRVLERGGSRAVTPAAVAAEASMGPGALYRYFRTPDALLTAWEDRMWERTLEEFRSSVDRALQFASGAPLTPEVMFEVARAAINLVARIARLYHAEPDYGALMARITGRVELIQRAASFLEGVLESARAEVLPVNLRLASMLVLKAVVYVAFHWTADRPADVASERFQVQMATMITRYLLKVPGAEPYRRDATKPADVAAEPRAADEAERAPRRQPSQPRSADTVAIILEATAKILAQGGTAAVTTTKVAATAGVSVGTLYQYFPTKAAILAAWEERTLEATLASISCRVSDALDAVLARGGRLGARGTYDLAFSVIDPFTRALMQHHLEPGEAAMMARASERLSITNRASEFVRGALVVGDDDVLAIDLDAAAFVIVATTTVLCFHWGSRHPTEVESGEFQREIATMFTRYIAREPGEEPYA